MFENTTNKEKLKLKLKHVQKSKKILIKDKAAEVFSTLLYVTASAAHALCSKYNIVRLTAPLAAPNNALRSRPFCYKAEILL